MNGSPREIVGREDELEAVGAFLSESARLPAALVLKGQPGIGKTTLWNAAVEEAVRAGYRVLACRPAGAEVRLSHSALTDLFSDVLEPVLPALPDPQRRALEAALLIADGGGRAPDRRAVAAGVLTGLRRLSAERSILLAVDDAQWLDRPSALALEFAVRRLTTEPVAVLLSWRVSEPATAADADRAMGAARIVRLELGPLSLGAMHRLLVEHRGHSFSRPTLRRIFETSGGNPFYAIELARAIDAEGEMAPGQPMRLPGTLEGLLVERLTALPDATRRSLSVAAAASEPTVPLLEAATGADARRSLEPALAAGLVRLDGSRVTFTHPLLAAAAYALPEVDRPAMHARLAQLAGDLEERARHLALASDGPDEELAGMLMDAGRQARVRGASATAAELMEAAVQRTPAEDERLRAQRSAEAARALILVGERRRARSLLDSALPATSGPLRAELLTSLSELVKDEPDGARRERALLEEAIDNAGDDARLHGRALLKLEMLERHAERFLAALPMARQALQLAERSGDDALLTEALTRTADLEVLTGTGGDPIARFSRAIDLDQTTRVDPADGPVAMLAVCLVRAGRLTEARPLLLRQRQRTLDEGDESSRDLICLFLAELEWLAGDWDAALEHAREGQEVVEQTGSEVMRAALAVPVALITGARGDLEGAIRLTVDGAALADAIDERSYASYNRHAQGFLELTRGNAEAAASLLSAHSEHGIEGTKRIAFAGDEIEACVRIGDLARAAVLVEELDGRGRLLGRPPLTAIAARGRALVDGAAGREVDEAALDAAMETFRTLDMPFELARTRLVLGEVRRRAKRKRGARDALDEAIGGFEALGAGAWVERARGELGRVGGRTRTGDLTATERRVAELVATGRSNKEVAAALFVSVRAVEANLTRIYAKLDVTSRTELVSALRAGAGPGELEPSEENETTR